MSNQFATAILSKENLSLFSKWIGIIVLLSTLIGFSAALFLYTLSLVTSIRTQNIWLIALLPIAGFVVGYIYHKHGKHIAAGNNLIIDTIQHPKQKVPFIMAPLVYIGTLVTHLFGGSAGREGTALQMAGGITAIIERMFKISDAERRTLLIGAVAGGFGAVFGTPLAGAIFALEFHRSSKTTWAQIVVSLAIAYAATFVCNLFPISHTHYHIGAIADLSFKNISYTIVVGAVFGITAWLFTNGLKYTQLFFKSFF